MKKKLTEKCKLKSCLYCTQNFKQSVKNILLLMDCQLKVNHDVWIWKYQFKCTLRCNDSFSSHGYPNKVLMCAWFFFQERIGACFERRILFLIKISSLSYTEYQKYLTYFTLNILPIRPKSLPFVKAFVIQSCSI